MVCNLGKDALIRNLPSSTGSVNGPGSVDNRFGRILAKTRTRVAAREECLTRCEQRSGCRDRETLQKIWNQIVSYKLNFLLGLAVVNELAPAHAGYAVQLVLLLLPLADQMDHPLFVYDQIVRN